MNFGFKIRKNYEKVMLSENQFHFFLDAAAKVHSCRKEVTFFDYLRFFESYHFKKSQRF